MFAYSPNGALAIMILFTKAAGLCSCLGLCVHVFVSARLRVYVCVCLCQCASVSQTMSMPLSMCVWHGCPATIDPCLLVVATRLSAEETPAATILLVDTLRRATAASGA